MKRHEDPYLSQAEFYAMRYIRRVQAVVGWIVVALFFGGLITLALNVISLFRA